MQHLLCADTVLGFGDLATHRATLYQVEGSIETSPPFKYLHRFPFVVQYCMALQGKKEKSIREEGVGNAGGGHRIATIFLQVFYLYILIRKFSSVRIIEKKLQGTNATWMVISILLHLLLSCVSPPHVLSSFS